MGNSILLIRRVAVFHECQWGDSLLCKESIAGYMPCDFKPQKIQSYRSGFPFSFPLG